MTWRAFLRWLLGASSALAGLLYAFILVLDPYAVVPFAPPLARAPVSTNQRFSYPALARDVRFDSAVIGTSTMRLLDPMNLDALTGARFVNLAMNSATAYEQRRIFELFLGARPAPNIVIIGNDGTWCARKAQASYTFRAFPEWMYDDSRWNDLLYLFNDKALEDAVRLSEVLLGWREPKYRRDGYRDFTRDFGRYDVARVRARLYRAPRARRASDDSRARPDDPAWRFPLVDELAALLARVPASTRIVLMYPPVHAHYLANLAVKVRECKGRTHARLAGFRNVIELDYMLPSHLVRDAANFWDPVHTTSAVARQLERDVAAAVSKRSEP